MNTKRTHVVLSDQLVKEIDTLVGTRQRSTFLTQAAEHELMRLRQLRALDTVAGAWKDKDHPELKQDAAKWVRKTRQETERRFQKVTAR
jgi:metal-responsive CopG/Arc/MetJ family transcriptional regulator